MAEVQIKICGIYRPEDTAIINRTRPDYFGMILNFPKSHRNLTPTQAEEIRSLVDPNIPAVGVFVNQPLTVICDLLERNIIQIAQLHGQESAEDILTLRQRTGKPVWKAFRVRSPEDIAAALTSPADCILLDNGYGTGQTFDWDLAQGLGRPFALAGGLTPENLSDAVRTLSPALVDISSGVETNKIKDPDKVRRAVHCIRSINRPSTPDE